MLNGQESASESSGRVKQISVKKEDVMGEIRFDGRVAVVTGAGGGLGKTYAIELAKRGAKVVVNDFGGARDGTGGGTSMADLVVQEIKDAGGEAVANYDGVHTKEGGANIIKQTVDAFGKVDILINNAGILRDKSFTKMTDELWDPVMAVHLTGVYYVTLPAWPIMRDNKFGRIIMTTSGTGLFGNFGQTNYGAAKLGQIGFMNSLGLEGAKYNVTVNAIAPIAASRLTEDIMPPDMLDKLRPDFVTPAVLYLCSEECTVSRRILAAGAGLVQRAAMLVNKGAFLGKEPATPEAVRDQWAKIDSLEDVMEYQNVMDGTMEALKHYG
jgi:NAD(P)-dependent dehydrogenase (short-subunit alcohol dehydrogenase family)